MDYFERGYRTTPTPNDLACATQFKLAWRARLSRDEWLPWSLCYIAADDWQEAIWTLRRQLELHGYGETAIRRARTEERYCGRTQADLCWLRESVWARLKRLRTPVSPRKRY